MLLPIFFWWFGWPARTEVCDSLQESASQGANQLRPHRVCSHGIAFADEFAVSWASSAEASFYLRSARPLPTANILRCRLRMARGKHITAESAVALSSVLEFRGMMGTWYMMGIGVFSFWANGPTKVSSFLAIEIIQIFLGFDHLEPYVPTQDHTFPADDICHCAVPM